MCVRFLLSSLVCFFALIAVNANANQTKVINWQTFHVPPLYMKVGEQVGEGFIDKMLALIIAGMPDYQHNMPLTTQARAIHDIQQGKQACHPALFKNTERQQYAVFSTAAFFTPSNRLIIHRNEAEKRQFKSPLDLTKILQQQDLSLALVQGRSYGPFIDQLIARYPLENILEISIERNEVVFQLVFSERVDATIAYPFELNYYNSAAVVDESLKAFVIADSPSYSVGYVACPNNAWGEAVIKQVNESLRSLVGTPEYLQAMTTWWREEAQTETFAAFYHSQFLVEYQPITSMSNNEH